MHARQTHNLGKNNINHELLISGLRAETLVEFTAWLPAYASNTTMLRVILQADFKHRKRPPFPRPPAYAAVLAIKGLR